MAHADNGNPKDNFENDIGAIIFVDIKLFVDLRILAIEICENIEFSRILDICNFIISFEFNSSCVLLCDQVIISR